MSLFSLVNLVLMFFILPCIFFYHPFILLLIIGLWVYLVLNYVVWDLFTIKEDRMLGFWLFLLTEIIIFATMLLTCLWFQDYYSKPIAYAYGIPMLETYILISTSFFMTTYHCLIKTDERHLYLNCSILYSFAFMILAVWEIINSNASSLHNPHSAACFLTIGLHFIHVIIGTVGLTELDYYDSSKLVRRYSNIIILYWHFVDYIWLFVYLIVYVLV
uniref:Cytochrome c oxidase subunit 3 n=1 Tax=Schistosoma mekongi TaxID=38744 RepID=Q9B8V2_SCHME|nr:cytochrome c oxidase subunit III [Schistosoma mekongi]AAG12179.2 cytochrome c oxidase subunit 3 [Schistosoma mekongi]